MTKPVELVERIPQNLVVRAQATTRFFSRLFVGAALAGFVPVATAVAVLPFRDQNAWSQLVVILIAGSLSSLSWASAVYAIGRAAAGRWSPANLPTVEIAHGEVKVVWHGEVIQAKVAECQFRIGDASQMKYASRKARPLFQLCERDVILIDMPPLYRDIFGCIRAYTTVAVGCTEESFGQWSDALGLADGKQRNDLNLRN
ncbi:MAG: hypothetical protein WBD20_06870 [Pirellulaceae bacterium]